MVRDWGMTWVEVLVVLILCSTVMMFAVPMGTSFYQKRHLEQRADEIISIVHFARIQAVLKGQPVVLTALTDSKNFSSGMMLFVGRDKQRFIHPDQLIHKWNWSTPSLQVYWKGFQSRDTLVFSPNLNHSATNGYFLIQAGHLEKRLWVNRIGRVSSRDPTS